MSSKITGATASAPQQVVAAVFAWFYMDGTRDETEDDDDHRRRDASEWPLGSCVGMRGRLVDGNVASRAGLGRTRGRPTSSCRRQPSIIAATLRLRPARRSAVSS